MPHSVIYDRLHRSLFSSLEMEGDLCYNRSTNYVKGQAYETHRKLHGRP